MGRQRVWALVGSHRSACRVVRQDIPGAGILARASVRQQIWEFGLTCEGRKRARIQAPPARHWSVRGIQTFPSSVDVLAIVSDMTVEQLEVGVFPPVAVRPKKNYDCA